MEESYFLSLKNDGEMPEGDIEPKGGLKILRSEIGEAGGTMKIVYSPDFVLEITLPKGEGYAGLSLR